LLGELRGADSKRGQNSVLTDFVRARTRQHRNAIGGGGAAAAAAAAVAAGAGAAPSRTGKHLGGSLQQQDAAL